MIYLDILIILISGYILWWVLDINNELKNRNKSEDALKGAMWAMIKEQRNVIDKRKAVKRKVKQNQQVTILNPTRTRKDSKPTK
jgi:hypothetical protein